MASYTTHPVAVCPAAIDSLLWLPDGTAPDRPRPGVLVVPGWGGYPYDPLPRALGPRLAADGVAVLSLGLRRRGGEGQLTALPDDDLADVAHGLDALAAHGVHAAVLVGQDVGALSAARYAAGGDPRVAGVALVDRIDDLHAFLVGAAGEERVRAWTDLATQVTYELKPDAIRVDVDVPRPGRPPLWIFQPAGPFLAWWTPQPRLRLPRVLDEVAVPVTSVAGNQTDALAGWVRERLPRPARPARFSLVEAGPLVGYLAEPDGGRTDAAVLIVHGLSTGPFSAMAKQFVAHWSDHGFTTLAMETRRSGARCIDSWPEHDVADVDAFVELLLARGFRSVVLAGASLGSQAISRYVGRRHHPAVAACVHLAPTGDMAPDTARNVDPRELARVVAEATDAVAAGRPEHLVRYDLTEQGPSRFHGSRRTFWRAASWLAWWGPDADTTHTDLIAEVDVPQLLVSGTADDYNDTARLDVLTAAAKRAPLVERLWIAGDHGFRGAERETVAGVVAWLERHALVAARPGVPDRPPAPVTPRPPAAHVFPTVEDHP